MMGTELRLSGSGGQGLILAGIILAEAAILEGRNAVQTQTYGPEARGGTSKAEVIISDDKINYPKVTEADIFLAMNKEACHKYLSEVKKGATAIVDETFVSNVPDQENAKIYKIPITQLARDEVGKELVANIVALGVLVEITKVVSREALVKAVLARIPKGTEELNTKALNIGFEAAQKALGYADKKSLRSII